MIWNLPFAIDGWTLLPEIYSNFKVSR